MRTHALAATRSFATATISTVYQVPLGTLKLGFGVRCGYCFSMRPENLVPEYLYVRTNDVARESLLSAGSYQFVKGESQPSNFVRPSQTNPKSFWQGKCPRRGARSA